MIDAHQGVSSSLLIVLVDVVKIEQSVLVPAIGSCNDIVGYRGPRNSIGGRK